MYKYIILFVQKNLNISLKKIISTHSCKNHEKLVRKIFYTVAFRLKFSLLSEINNVYNIIIHGNKSQRLFKSSNINLENEEFKKIPLKLP
jgi:hypothetical protein